MAWSTPALHTCRRFLMQPNSHSHAQLVGFLMIGVGVYGRAASIVDNLPIVGGILACGIILILISILGLVGAVRHHQVMLFFVSGAGKLTGLLPITQHIVCTPQYMLILSMLFVIQFSIAVSCLAVREEQQRELAEEGWNRAPDSIRAQVQDTFLCCGFNGTESKAAVQNTELSCDKVTVSVNRFILVEPLFGMCFEIRGMCLCRRSVVQSASSVPAAARARRVCTNWRRPFRTRSSCAAASGCSSVSQRYVSAVIYLSGGCQTLQNVCLLLFRIQFF